MKSCIIVGGGPAGLTAALYLARFLRGVTVFDTCDGRAGLIPKTHNIAPFPDGISGPDLLDRMRTHAAMYGAILERGPVRRVEKLGDVFNITTDSQSQWARTVIFATGVFNHRPPLSPQEHDRGLAQGLIRYCPVCDAFEVRGRRIAVLGNGEHGAKEARFIRQYSASVTLIPTDGSVGVAQRGIDALEAPLDHLALAEDEVLVTLQTGQTCRFDTLYVALGSTARADSGSGLGLRLAKGHIAVDAQQRTSVAGAYAIGDVTEGLDQIAVAMGQGAIAATAIHNSLDDAGQGAEAQGAGAAPGPRPGHRGADAQGESA